MYFLFVLKIGKKEWETRSFEMDDESSVSVVFYGLSFLIFFMPVFSMERSDEMLIRDSHFHNYIASNIDI